MKIKEKRKQLCNFTVCMATRIEALLTTLPMSVTAWLLVGGGKV